MSDPEFLQERNSQLELQVRNLQESVGRWKREAQGVQQRHERGQHYISVPVESLPSDTPLHEAQEYIRDHVLPKFYPYKYYNCYSSRRYSGWVVTMVREDRDVDMDAGPASAIAWGN